MAPISMKTKTSGPLSPGTSASGGMRNSGFMGGTASGTAMTGSSKGGGGSKSTSSGKSSQDILKDLKKEISRREFFKGRQDVSDDRLLKRYQMDEELRKYKQDLIRQGKYVKDAQGNPVKTASGDYVYTATSYFDTDSSSPTFGRHVTYGVNDKMEDLARQYGPKLKDIFGDIGYGLGSIGKGFAEKGTPMIQLFKGLSDKFKGGVEAAWDAVRGEPTSSQGTAFPQPGSDTKDLFSSIDTGIAEIAPDNMLVQIAKANEGRFDDKPTFQEQLANATVENLNIPSIEDIMETASDYTDAYLSGINLDTPIGNININPASQGVSLGNYIPTGDMTGISYGGFFKPEDNSYNVGIGTQLPYDIGLSAGVSSNDAPGVALSKYVPLNIPGSGGAIPFVNFSPEGSSLGFNASFDPVRALYPNASIGLPLNIGASVSDQGKIDPRIGFNIPFNSSGLGYMFK